MTDAEKIAERLLNFRKNILKKTMAEVSSETGIDASAIQRAETAQSEKTQNRLINIYISHYGIEEEQFRIVDQSKYLLKRVKELEENDRFKSNYLKLLEDKIKEYQIIIEEQKKAIYSLKDILKKEVALLNEPEATYSSTITQLKKLIEDAEKVSQ